MQKVSPHLSPGKPDCGVNSRSWAPRLRRRDLLIRRIRHFFQERGDVEVETPIRVLSPGIDPYIDALPAGEGHFLATSPEQEMKKLLAAGLDRIFQITRAFRAGEHGSIHNPEFSILEWYAAEEDYTSFMSLTEDLVWEGAAALEEGGFSAPAREWPRPFHRMRVDSAFRKYAGWEPSSAFSPDPFFHDLIEKVEPALAGERAVFLFDYPERVGSLARKKHGNPLLCERFELYLEGLEICNGFTELTDAGEQGRRFARDNEERRRLGKSAYPVDPQFMNALGAGIPSCAGNALGIDRLLLALTGYRDLREVSLLSGSADFSGHGDRHA